MMHLRTPLVLLVAGLTVASCAGQVQWRYYAPFRSIGRTNVVSPVDPGEVHYAGVAAKLHYVSLSLDGVFFRNLPKTTGKLVALGVSLNGALPTGELSTVTEAVAAVGPDGQLFFERPFVVAPFLYRGVPLRLTLTFRVVGKAESANLLGRLASLGARKLIPGQTERLKQHRQQFEAFLGGNYKGKVYTYTFSLYPSDMEGVRQDLVLTGGRHIYVGIPAGGSSGRIKKISPADVAYKVRISGRRLEWRLGNRDYTESPYLLLSVIRYKRYPSEEIPLRRAEKSVDRFIEQGNWVMARSNLAGIGTALLEERSITQMERNLVESQRDVRSARIDAGVAEQKGDAAALLKAVLKQVRLLGNIAKDFQQILEPYEVKDTLFRVRRLSRQADELARKLGSPAREVKDVAASAMASIRMPPEPPANPSLLLKPPKVVQVVVTRPEPFYKKWWFYTLVGVATAGLVTGGTVVALQKDPNRSGATIFLDKPAPVPRR